jgi:hypothetical protein
MKGPGAGAGPDPGFTWSDQDFLLITKILKSNIVFVSANPTGNGIRINKFFYNENSKFFILIWGPNQLLVTNTRADGITKYYVKQSALPADVQQMLPTAVPILYTTEKFKQLGASGGIVGAAEAAVSAVASTVSDAMKTLTGTG